MADIQKWDVEDEEFWESEGKKIATRNLWISIPSLLATCQMVSFSFASTLELFR